MLDPVLEDPVRGECQATVSKQQHLPDTSIVDFRPSSGLPAPSFGMLPIASRGESVDIGHMHMPQCGPSDLLRINL